MARTLSVLSTSSFPALHARLSQASDGSALNQGAFNARLSADGRYLVYETAASNLVNGDTNNFTDVFRRDLLTGQTILVSSGAQGVGNSVSKRADISANGQFVVFESGAQNLVGNDSNGVDDIFVKNLLTGEIKRVTVSAGNAESNAGAGTARISADGRYVVFASAATNLHPDATNGKSHIYRKDLHTGAVDLISSVGQTQAGSDSWFPRISADGKRVVFTSLANTLDGGDTNGKADVFVKDFTKGGEVRLVSRVGINGDVGTQGGDEAEISADGRYVVFQSASNNLVTGDANNGMDIFRKNLDTGVIELVSRTRDGTLGNGDSLNAHVSADGRYVVFESDASNLVAGDTYGLRDVFRKDMVTGEIVRLSVAPAPHAPEVASGHAWSAYVSGDGRYVYFENTDPNLVDNDQNGGVSDIFRKDLLTGTITIVSRNSAGVQLDDSSYGVKASADGRYVVFMSNAPNLNSGGPVSQAYRRDLATGAVVKVSTNTDNEQANNTIDSAQISDDGRYVLFETSASNLVDGDTNNRVDVFRKDVATGDIVRVSVDQNGAQGDNANHDAVSQNASMSSDGKFVVFESTASNLVAGDTNNAKDIFLKNVETGAVTLLSSSSGPNPVQGNDESSYGFFSGNGRYVFFRSQANNLVPGQENDNTVDAFRKDLVTGDVILVSTTANGQEMPEGFVYAASADGRYVAIDFDTGQLYLKDLATGSLRTVSVTQNGIEANDNSQGLQVSPDGRYVFFSSEATNLLPGSHEKTKIFRKDMVTGELVCMTTGPAVPGLEEGGAASYDPFISADGQTVIFGSQGSNFVYGDNNGLADIFGMNFSDLSLAQAALEGRYIRATLGVGNAWSGSITWDDGTVDLLTPSFGAVQIGHAFASAGLHGATITLNEGGQSWKVAYLVNTQTGQLTRNFSQYDTVEGGAGSDVLTGDAYANHLVGSLGHDTLEGGAGADMLEGGVGNDTYLVDTSDILVEGAGGGIDTVIVSASYALSVAAEIEVLKLTGVSSRASASLTGSATANEIIGHAGRTSIKAGSGNDKLQGGLGNDSLWGQGGKDVFVFDTRPNKSSNVDRIYDFRSADDSVYLDNKYFTKLGSGSLSRPKKFKSDMFTEGKAARDAEDRIVYDRKTGALYYDQDGTGSKAQVKIATITNKTKLYYHDFFVI